MGATIQVQVCECVTIFIQTTTIERTNSDSPLPFLHSCFYRSLVLKVTDTVEGVVLQELVPVE